MEIWKDIPDHPGYQVSNQGQVRSYVRPGYGERWLYSIPHMLKPGARGKKGYPGVGLGKGFQSTVGRLVLLAFIGPCPEGMEACHNDGIVNHNSLDNLRWGTPQSNAADKIRHGTDPSGERNAMAKLTDDEVYKIREMYASGDYTTGKLADIFSVRHSAISRIVTGKRRKTSPGVITPEGTFRDKHLRRGKDNFFGQHPGYTSGENNPRAVLNDAKVIAIRNRFANGEKSTALAKEFGVCSVTILHVVHGIIWKHVGGPIT